MEETFIGSLSKLPIGLKDEIVVFICAISHDPYQFKYSGYGSLILNNFNPSGKKLVPISLPIRTSLDRMIDLRGDIGLAATAIFSITSGHHVDSGLIKFYNWFKKEWGIENDLQSLHELYDTLSDETRLQLTFNQFCGDTEIFGDTNQELVCAIDHSWIMDVISDMFNDDPKELEPFVGPHKIKEKLTKKMIYLLKFMQISGLELSPPKKVDMKQYDWEAMKSWNKRLGKEIKRKG